MRLLAIVLIIFLTACSGTEVKPTKIVFTKIECGAVPKADSVHMAEVKPWVMTDKSGVVWIAMTPKHYENMSLNMAQIKRLLTQKNSIIKFYVSCINSYNENAKASSEILHGDK